MTLLLTVGAVFVYLGIGLGSARHLRPTAMWFAPVSTTWLLLGAIAWPMLVVAKATERLLFAVQREDPQLLAPSPRTLSLTSSLEALAGVAVTAIAEAQRRPLLPSEVCTVEAEPAECDDVAPAVDRMPPDAGWDLVVRCAELEEQLETVRAVGNQLSAGAWLMTGHVRRHERTTRGDRRRYLYLEACAQDWDRLTSELDRQLEAV